MNDLLIKQAQNRIVEIEREATALREYLAIVGRQPRPTSDVGVARGALQQQMLTLLRQNGEMRQSDIARATGTSQENLAQTCNRMIAKGLVERVSRGVYRATAAAEQESSK